MKHRDLGRLGETTLEHWCAQVGIVANRAQVDRTGWDYLLEFPSTSPAAHIPPDVASAAIQCLVQVKATDLHRTGRPVKLSNWKRLVTTPLPAFFLVVEFDGRRECTAAYLVHVDHRWIEIVLRRLRELGTRETPTALNKHSLVLTCAPADRLAALDGASLAEAIRRIVGSSLPIYAQHKHDLLARVGYEDHGSLIEAQSTFRSESPQEYLADFSLGLRGPLKIDKGAKVWDQRFGIRHPIPRLIHSAGSLIARSRGRGTVRLRSGDGSITFAESVEIWSTGVLGKLIPEHHHKIRFHGTQADFFFFPADLNRWQVSLSVPQPDTEYTLAHLVDFAQLLTVLETATRDAAVCIEVDAGEMSFSGSLSLDDVLDPKLLDLGSTIRAASRISLRASLGHHTSVNVADLWRHGAHVRALDSALRGDHAVFDVTWTPVDPIPGALVCMPAVISAWIGQSVVAAGVAFIGATSDLRAIQGTGDVRLTTSAVEVVEVVSGSREATPIRSERALIERVASRYVNSHAVVRWWDVDNDDPPNANHVHEQ